MIDPTKPDSNSPPQEPLDDGLDDADDLDEFEELENELNEIPLEATDLDAFDNLDDDEADEADIDLDFDAEDKDDQFDDLADDLTDEHDPALELDELEGETDDNWMGEEPLESVLWTTEVRIDGVDSTVPAILDPTLATTTWTRPGAEVGPAMIALRIGSIHVRVLVAVVDGPDSALRIGRDVLAGRILVRSE